MVARDDGSAQVRRLLTWNRAWLGLLLLGGLFLFARAQVRELQRGIRELRVSWRTDGSVHLSAASDGPFVVTHLALLAESRFVRATAELRRPLAVIDSGGASLSESEVERLVWLGPRGQRVNPPRAGTPLSALYFEPKIARPR